MIAITWWQTILNALGWVLARIYDLVPNYGIAIILLTLVIRVLLLPLAIKQIRSMQAMQVLQPKLKEIQKKYKGNREKVTQETMALYKEYGASPLSGCLPLLLQFPVLIALYAIIRFPNGLAHVPHDNIKPIGQPQDSRLYVDILNQKTKFLGVNLLCSASQAGSIQKLAVKGYPDAQIKLKNGLDCGHGVPSRIPYYLLSALMIGTTYFQQRQMQRASPAVNQQQQALTRIMPLLFGFWGFIFPAGLVLYWTTTNLVQIAQQYFMLVRRQQATPDGEMAVGDGGKGSGDGKATPRRASPAKGGRGRAGAASSKPAPTPKRRAGTSKSSGSNRGSTGRGDSQGKVRGRLSGGGQVKGRLSSGGGSSGGRGEDGGSKGSGSTGGSRSSGTGGGARGSTGGQGGAGR